jgi:hypothetical protein
MIIKAFILFFTLFAGGAYNITTAQEAAHDPIAKESEIDYEKEMEKAARIKREFVKQHAKRIYGETQEKIEEKLQIKRKQREAKAAIKKKLKGFKRFAKKAKKKVAVPIHTYAAKKLKTESSRIYQAFIDANKYNINVKGSTPTSKTNVATTPLNEANKMAAIYAGVVTLQKQLPNFQENYKKLQAKCKQAKNIQRSSMPVIRKDQIKELIHLLKSGAIDIKPPYYIKAQRGLLTPLFYSLFPMDLHKFSKERREKWLTHGHLDGNLDDDKIKVTEEWIEAEKLIPTQSQLWLSKLIAEISMYGAPTSEKARGRKTILVIGENIIAEHHHWAKIFLTDPTLKVKINKIHLLFRTGQAVIRSFGGAKGNEPQK